MRVKIFSVTYGLELDELEKEINDFLTPLSPGAVVHTQTAMAAVRDEDNQPEAQYVVTIWYDEGVVH